MAAAHSMFVKFELSRFIFRKLILVCANLTCSLGCVFAQSGMVRLPMQTQWLPSQASPDAARSGNLASDLSLISSQTNSRISMQIESASSGAERVLIGGGDQIFIAVFGQPDMSAEVTVNENGQVTLPLLGTLKVSGLPPQDIERLVAKRLKDGEYLKNPEVSVQVRQLRSQVFSVLGEVQRPGRFPLQGRLTVLDALATAGGLTARADRTLFLIRRNQAKGAESQRQEILIELDQLVDRSRGAVDIELMNEDVVFITQQKFFYIHGEVRRPGAYPMEPDLNLMKAISLGGGVTERGSIKRIKIHRQLPDKKLLEIKPDLSAGIQSGDVIYVDERLF